jgi:colanic acid/amylovoran biosynthesis glycosyltransferase
MRIGHFTNQYPAVSHTFIRREIRALEFLGVTVVRYALWTSAEDLVDPEDKVEQQQTQYILKAPIGEFLRCIFAAVATRPSALIRTVWLAAKIGWRSDRGILRHFAYVAEAIVLATWCKRDRVQHVHAHFGTNSAAIAMLVSQFSGITYSFTAHGSEEFEKAPLLSLDVKLRNAAFAVAVSSFGRSQLMRWSPPDQWGKVILVHCGVDHRFLDAELSPPLRAPRLVCVGRFDEHKAQLILVAAARRLHDAGTNFTIVLVGDGPMRPLIETAIRQHGLEDHISITGWVTGAQVQAEIVGSRALVLPSFSENMPVVIMEALALGRPVISTYVAGIPELVQADKSGWLVPASDEVALVQAMTEALTAPIEQLAAMGIAGRNRICKCHDALKEAAKLKECFQKVIDAFQNPPMIR